MVGQHVVRISAAAPKSGPASDEIVRVPDPFPAAAGDGSLRFEVPAGGTDQADFGLRR